MGLQAFALALGLFVMSAINGVLTLAIFGDHIYSYVIAFGLGLATGWVYATRLIIPWLRRNDV